MLFRNGRSRLFSCCTLAALSAVVLLSGRAWSQNNGTVNIPEPAVVVLPDDAVVDGNDSDGGEGIDEEALSPLTAAEAAAFSRRLSVLNYRYLLPAAPDPNFFISSPFSPRSQFGDAYTISRTQGFIGEGLFSRIGGNASLAIPYDTGYMNPKDFSPSGVTLNGDPDLRQRGFFQMTSLSETAQGKMIWDVSSVRATTGTVVQGFLELTYKEGILQTQNVYGRIVSRLTTINFGESQSFAAHDAALPTSLYGNVRPVGSLSGETVASLSFTRLFHENRIELGMAIENPRSDYVVPAGHVRLSRIPTLVGRVRIQGAHLNDGLHLAAFTRSFGQENAAGQESWTQGWGISCIGRKVINCRNELFMGFSGGEGVGDLIFGVEHAAGPEAIGTGLTTIPAYGAYAGIAHLWHEGDYFGQLWSNFVGGYSYQGSDAVMPADSIHRAHQAYANLIWQTNTNVAFGLEYHYLDRDVRSGLRGENHRFGLVVMISTKSEKKEDPVSAEAMFYRESGVAGADPTMYMRSL